MKFKIEEWTIIDLIVLHDKEKLILDPPYQRNFIWTKKDQESLIDSIINKEFPLPTFFLLKKEGGIFEMVDGQQRTRTILNFHKKNFDVPGIKIDRTLRTQLESFKLSMTIIIDTPDTTSIEEFYARVNKTGKKLNRPELNKAQYFNTRFLELNEDLAGQLQALELFTESSTNRMNDVDLVSEIVTMLYYGFTDKKDKVDELYESDLTTVEVKEIKARFNMVMKTLIELDKIERLYATRYSQRNDLYTLFYFIDKYSNLDIETFKVFYDILLLISDDIAPSNDDCEPFKEYAINCVSQSNSKRAREKRHQIFEEILLNQKSKPNDTQIKIFQFYELEQPKLKKVENFYTLDPEALREIKEG